MARLVTNSGQENSYLEQLNEIFPRKTGLFNNCITKTVLKRLVVAGNRYRPISTFFYQDNMATRLTVWLPTCFA